MYLMFNIQISCVAPTEWIYVSCDAHNLQILDCVWNVMAHTQKPDFVFQWNGRVHLNRRGRQFSWLLAGELCTSACRVCTAHASLHSVVMWGLLVTHSILLFPLHFPSRASPCAITFQLDSTSLYSIKWLVFVLGTECRDWIHLY